MEKGAAGLENHRTHRQIKHLFAFIIFFPQALVIPFSPLAAGKLVFCRLCLGCRGFSSRCTGCAYERGLCALQRHRLSPSVPPLFRDAEMSSVIFLPEETACPFRLRRFVLRVVRPPLSAAPPKQSAPHSTSWRLEKGQAFGQPAIWATGPGVAKGTWRWHQEFNISTHSTISSGVSPPFWGWDGGRHMKGREGQEKAGIENRNAKAVVGRLHAHYFNWM